MILNLVEGLSHLGVFSRLSSKVVHQRVKLVGLHSHFGTTEDAFDIPDFLFGTDLLLHVRRILDLVEISDKVAFHNAFRLWLTTTIL